MIEVPGYLADQLDKEAAEAKKKEEDVSRETTDKEGVDKMYVDPKHYAGSFVYLMRAAGIPARVVTGYQGGERNGDYYIVRQSDAHVPLSDTC